MHLKKQSGKVLENHSSRNRPEARSADSKLSTHDIHAHGDSQRYLPSWWEVPTRCNDDTEHRQEQESFSWKGIGP